MRPLQSRSLPLFLGLAALPLAASAINLIDNGDFESGNIGFSSEYLYAAPNGGGNPSSRYTIGTNPKNFNGAFFALADHTSGSGNMMIVNGSTVASQYVWSSTSIAIAPDTDYFFEAFVASVYPASPAILSYTVSLDGGAETTLATLGGSALSYGAWTGFSTTFNSGSATSAVLFLRNAQTASGGNDFAVDDVYLGVTSVVNPPAVPEPASSALMLLGLAGLLRLRRAGPVRREGHGG